MKAAAFDYVRPADLGAALRHLAEGGGEAKPLAGGQSLGPMLNLRLARPKLLVDISRLQELRRIADAGDHWRVGAAVTHSELEDAAGKLEGAELVAQVASGIAYRSVRNRGTIGGSLAHADPAGDWPLALAALDATVVIAGSKGERKVPADQFMQAAFTTALADGEAIVAILVPKLSKSHRVGYYKFCRKTGEFPEASACAIFDPERRIARLFLGATQGAPIALPEMARAVAEGRRAVATPEAALAAVGALEEPERRMRAAVLMRAIEQAYPA
ncbi:MAG TPA: FAD binding domain-containing protein [Stellaceae bacterium]|nr:FAD binding domain-containing protein [Stellaceae bacterium]